MTKITIGVSRVYKNNGRLRIFHRKKTKRPYKHYFMSDDYTEHLKFYTEYVSSAKAQILKLKKHYLRTFYCPACLQRFYSYVKNGRVKPDCPYCDEDED